MQNLPLMKQHGNVFDSSALRETSEVYTIKQFDPDFQRDALELGWGL